MRASGFHDDYNEEVKIALALGAKPDAVNEFNVLFGADSESEYCFKCSPDLLIEAYDFVHSSENEQAFSNLRFGLYIKAFFQFELRRRRFLQERSAGIEKNSTESDSSSIEKN